MKERKIVEIPMKKIEPDPDQMRKVFKTEPMKELVEGLEKGDPLPPVVVRTVGDDRYRIIVGERYWRAAGLARFETVPCEIRDDLRERETRLLQLRENYHTEKVNPIDQARSWLEHMDKYEVSLQQLAEEMGANFDVAAYYVGLVKNLTPSLWDKVERGFVGGITMTEASLLAKIPDKERQVGTYQTFIGNRINAQQFEQLVEAVMKYPDVQPWRLLEGILDRPRAAGVKRPDESKSLVEQIREFNRLLERVDLDKCLEEEGGFWPDLYRKDLVAQLDYAMAMVNKVRGQLIPLRPA